MLASLRFDHALMRQFLREALMRESVIYQDILQEGLQKGLQQGLQQGEQKIVLRLLIRRLGKLSPALKT